MCVCVFIHMCTYIQTSVSARINNYTNNNTQSQQLQQQQQHHQQFSFCTKAVRPHSHCSYTRAPVRGVASGQRLEFHTNLVGVHEHFS